MLQKLLAWLELAVEQEKQSEETGTQMETSILNVCCLTGEKSYCKRNREENFQLEGRK